MKITMLCSSRDHGIWPRLEALATELDAAGHVVCLESELKQVGTGDFLFLVSCMQIVGPEVRNRFRWSLVLHASNLPHGRGFSPVVWQVLEGADNITLSLIEAADPVDSGRIWAQRTFAVDPGDLWWEINHRLFDAELDLIRYAVEHQGDVQPRDQTGEATWYPRRRLEDSRVDPHTSIASQFDLLRICDPDRYPAFFELHGHRYRIRLDKET